MLLKPSTTTWKLSMESNILLVPQAIAVRDYMSWSLSLNPKVFASITGVIVDEYNERSKYLTTPRYRHINLISILVSSDSIHWWACHNLANFSLKQAQAHCVTICPRMIFLQQRSTDLIGDPPENIVKEACQTLQQTYHFSLAVIAHVESPTNLPMNFNMGTGGQVFRNAKTRYGLTWAEIGGAWPDEGHCDKVMINPKVNTYTLATRTHNVHQSTPCGILSEMLDGTSELALLAATIVSGYLIFRKLSSHKTLPLPPGPPSYPVIGQLLYVPQSSEAQEFADIGEKLDCM